MARAIMTLLAAVAMCWSWAAATAAQDVAVGDWERLFETDDSVNFVREAPSAGAYRRVWNRIDLNEPSGEGEERVQSIVFLMEIDCKERKYRQLQVTGFSESGLQGKVRTFPGKMQWEYAIPGTGYDAAIRYGCS